MSIITTPNTPYYDDFDKTKKFLRVLFRPSYAVQTRELNQLQTILNDQISSFADFFFKNGQRVIGGEVQFTANQPFIAVNNTLSRTNTQDYIGTTITDSTNSLSAVVVAVERANGEHLDLLYLEYKNTSATDNITVDFPSTTAITITHKDGSIESNVVGGFGRGSIVNIREGIFYILGQFVQTDNQTLIVSKLTPVADTELNTLGFEVTQKLVSPEEDQSLLDNALGTPNETAPGAHRLAILTELKREGDVTDIQNFIKIVTLRGKDIVTEVRNTDLSVFEDILARRTFDESGDYVVDDFLLDVREHKNNGSNRGLYDDGDETKLGIILDQVKAYVRGYEIQTTSNTLLETPKARDTDSKTALLIDGTYTSAFFVTNPIGLPQLFSVVTLQQGGINIGTAYVRGFTYKEQELGVSVYQLDFFNPTLNVGKSVNDVTKILQPTSSFECDVIGVDVNGQNSTNIFDIPFGFVSNVTNVNFTYTRSYVGTVTGTTLAITCAVNDQFLSGIDNYVVTVNGVTRRPVSVTRSSNNTQATLDLSNYSNINGATATVIALTTRTGGVLRSKNLTSAVETLPAASTLTLSKVDVSFIESITFNGGDITSYYELDGGQRDTHYDFATLKLRAGFIAPIGSIIISYKYFEHGSGDYFAAQSYTNVPYEQIPFYTNSSGIKQFLGSVLDFRPRYASPTSYELSGAQTLSAKDDIASNFSYFLSRIDKITLDKTGKFVVVNGTPAVDPVEPQDIDAAITLYKLRIPAYTFSTKDVVVEKIDQRRFTMRDIGGLVDRIQTLEYTTALSLLEADANQRDLVGKFKSGFVVDNFRTYDVGESENANHEIGIDIANGIASAIPISESIGLGLSTSASTNFVNNNGVITLPFTEVVEINQPLASRLERLQPYTLFNWVGEGTLKPNIDNWISTRVLPDIVLTNTINQM